MSHLPSQVVVFIIIMNISVGVLTLLIYVVVARGYKNRKRDDICNIYRYALKYTPQNDIMCKSFELNVSVCSNDL